MFSYRHAFHAGNHADVLKHAILVHILDHFNLKDNPYWVMDTHAGAGIYDLTSDWASTNGEFADGLDRLLGPGEKPELITRYLEEVQRFNPDGVANFYPGSPWLALGALRDKDRLRLFEMHPSEVEVLKHNLAQQDKLAIRQTAVYEADGFSGLKALLPPPTRRGIVLVDPSYEDKSDYRKVMQALDEGLKRFATGCYVVWYPLVQRREVAEMTRSLEKLKVQWTHATLTVRKPAKTGFGLHGSGMFVINPPYTLRERLEQALPWLATTLAQDDRAGHTLKASA
ncbi:23S rRNA (adenine(2030)-N(6))-methyltransferase RlmJ [Pusillimonas noertemannii]|uniref:Ribosomal RNA large subunit methyltransferase J n=1 Tax=Pusillimonas noertemannii TaxID=305977 RepID=A0A2U1CJU9_9BURK|nr:23S rRNA (adenine(2030)-N(6))-methyltransferase RlmJ [Pusillimonas noertemannii]NYT69790.1 23S rRNA (adenine(2030)-N(6))-methyltransferase RlmJ [Pusillimonas noertemannii]PVY61286.1 23S rRNA (adenine2030-N6)-methyltransferase [Pusillimonas noertemannii]TFL09093.1 23S rRNA (adenine(2030)-N(6))-methyltransferase RlmJ [Pusillimonas noertemannii]